MSTTKEYWLLCEDYGSYEGGIDPIGLFETEESAKEWAFKNLKHYSSSKEDFMSMFYLHYWLGKLEVYEK